MHMRALGASQCQANELPVELEDGSLDPCEEDPAQDPFRCLLPTNEPEPATRLPGFPCILQHHEILAGDADAGLAGAGVSAEGDLNVRQRLVAGSCEEPHTCIVVLAWPLRRTPHLLNEFLHLLRWSHNPVGAAVKDSNVCSTECILWPLPRL